MSFCKYFTNYFRFKTIPTIEKQEVNLLITIAGVTTLTHFK